MVRRSGSSVVRKEMRASGDVSRTKSFLLIAAVVVVVVAIAIVVYLKFVKDRPAHAQDLIPADADLVVSLNWQTSSLQGQNFQTITSRLGSQDVISSVATFLVGSKVGNSTVSFTDDVAPWLNGDIVLMRRNFGDEKIPSVFLPVGDISAKESFLNKIKGEADSVSTERYRGYQITTVGGKDPISYIEARHFVVFSLRVQALQSVVDVLNKSAHALSEAPDYKIVAAQQNEEHVVTVFSDVRDLLRRIPNLDTTKFPLDTPTRLGIAVRATTSGLAFDINAPGSDAQQVFGSNFKDELSALVPDSAAAYLGGHGADGFLRSYLDSIFSSPLLASRGLSIQGIQETYNVSFEDDLYSLLKGEFGIVDFEDGKTSTYALLVKVEDSAVAKAKMAKIEKAIEGIINQNRTAGTVAFKDGATFGTPIRYIGIPGNSDLFLNYAIRDNLLVLSTNRDGLERVLERKNTDPSLASSEGYHLSGQGLSLDSNGGTLYLNKSFVIDLLSAFGIDLSQAKDRMAGLRLVSTPIDNGVSIKGFLPVL